MSKVALQATLCYNNRKNTVALAMLATSKSVTKERYFFRMDSLSPETHLKQCSNPHCEDPWLPATSDFFYHDKRAKDGLQSACKKCQLKDKKSYYEAHREQIKIYKDKYNAEHREQHKQYLEEHSDKIREQQHSYYQSHSEHLRQYTTQYRRTERGIMAMRAHRRKRKAREVGRHTTEELYQQYHRQKGKCYYCQAKLGKGKNTWHADHIIPLSRGGSNYIDNIVIACPPCNQSKYNKLPHEWRDGGRLL